MNKIALSLGLLGLAADKFNMDKKAKKKDKKEYKSEAKKIEELPKEENKKRAALVKKKVLDKQKGKKQ